MSTEMASMRRNRWLLLLVRTFCVSVSMAIPTITVYWRSRGLSLGQFYLLEIIFALALVVLEVATGRFADLRGKVSAFRYGVCAQLAALLIYPIAHNFSAFASAEILMALGIALCSGADEAFLFQSCKALGEETLHNRWWSVANACAFGFMAVCAIAGGLLGAIDLRLPYFVAAGFQVVSLILVAQMTEPPVGAGANQHVGRGAITAAIKAVFYDSSSIRWMVIAPGFLAAVNQAYVWTYPDVLRECGYEIWELGLVFALFHVVAGTSAALLRTVRHDLMGVAIFFWLAVSLAGSTVGMLMVTGAWIWLIILPQQVIRATVGTLFSGTINQAIPDQVRATALSVRNAARVTIYVAAMTPWCLGIDSYGKRTLFVWNFAAIVCGMVFCWRYRPQRTTSGNGS